MSFARPAAVVFWSLMETRGFPVFIVPLAGSRPGGRVTSLRRQRGNQERRPRRAGRLLRSRLPCAAHNRRPAQNSRATPAQTAAPDFPACCSAAQRLGRGFPESPSVAGRACVCDERVKGGGLAAKTGVFFCALITQVAPVKARCLLKAPSEPPSSAAAGGAFRRSCLSPRSGRVLRRPPDASSAGESLGQAQLEPRTGEAGVASLPTFLATQESRAPAGARPGQRNAKRRKALGPHQRPENKPACTPGQRNANQQKFAGPHQRTAKHSVSVSLTHPADVGLPCANPAYGTDPHQPAASREWWCAPWRAKG